jgi:hypothetical protein
MKKPIKKLNSNKIRINHFTVIFCTDVKQVSYLTGSSKTRCSEKCIDRTKEILYILGITTRTKIREVQLPIMWGGIH